MDFTHTQLWLFADSVPYDGKPYDYLIEGVGWCDYHAKVFGHLLASQGIHVRYDFLLDRYGVSPHTIAEMFIDGKWRAVDPFHGLIFDKANGEWAQLSELSAEFVAQQAEVRLLAQHPVYQTIMDTAKRTYPPPREPQRSDDFLADRNILDQIAGLYPRLLGKSFVIWYQDRYLQRQLPRMAAARAQWYRVRSYHLFGRYTDAEVGYREIISSRELDATRQTADMKPYQQRAELFLSQLLIEQQRYADALHVITGAVQAAATQQGQQDWMPYYAGRCYEALGDSDQARHFYAQIQDAKLFPERVKRLATFMRDVDTGHID